MAEIRKKYEPAFREGTARLVRGISAATLGCGVNVGHGGALAPRRPGVVLAAGAAPLLPAHRGTYGRRKIAADLTVLRGSPRIAPALGALIVEGESGGQGTSVLGRPPRFVGIRSPLSPRS